MKKSMFVAVLAILISTVTMAQNTRFGFTAGMTVASQKYSSQGISITGKSIVGLTAGVLAEVPLAEKIAFMPGLNFTQKGGKLSFGDDEDDLDAKQTLNYIELPLNFVFHTQAGTGKFFAGLGPAIGYGIGGKAKGTVNGMSASEDIHFGTGEDDSYKPFELSGNILAGYELPNGLFFSVNYNMGLNNIGNIPDDEDDSPSVKNRYFGIRIGYFLKRK